MKMAKNSIKSILRQTKLACPISCAIGPHFPNGEDVLKTFDKSLLNTAVTSLEYTVQ